ncbi:MAG: type II toxin-antitoxin system prevent-host-death family antitoxin [Opitutaceae bacterium]
MKKSKRVLGVRALMPKGTMRVEEPMEWRRRTEVSVREAKDQLSALLQRAELGEEIVITSDGEPVAMLVRFRPRAGGKPWQSLAEFRATMPMTADSTAQIRESRDSGY